MDKYIATDDITVCPGCDMIVATTPLEAPPGSQLVCPRCKFKLHIPRRDTVNRTLAFSLTGLLLFIPAHFMLLLQLEALGILDHGTVIDSMAAIYNQKYVLVALIILLTAILFPFLKLLLVFVVSLGLAKNLFSRHLPFLFRWYCRLEEWGMTEVFLIAVLVTIIKMKHTADISYEAGFVCFSFLSLVLVCTVLALDKHHYWKLIEKHKQDDQLSGTGSFIKASRVQGMRTGLSAGLVQCHVCHKVISGEQAEPGNPLHCPRCGAVVHERIPNSVSMTWALVLTALILSFPANLLPIMKVDFLGIPDRSTIMDGITYFFQSGSYGIGIIILTASILVPVFKIVGLSLLLYSIHFGRGSRLAQKSIMFRFIEFIGRWSMLDIFVIALLCALVDFGFFTRISVMPAATFFSFVVLATMFAAISFDPRLIWDAAFQKGQAYKE